jgi:Type III secretion system, cytoplasmic E component of needle
VSEQRIFMTALEEQLHSPQGEEVRESVFSLMDRNREQVKAEIDRGVSPDDFRIYSKVLEALEAASEVMKVSS